MIFEKKEVGQYQVLIVLEKVDIYNISEFKKVLYEMTSGNFSHVAVELTENYTDMTSTVIGALVSGQKKMSALKGTFVIINPSEIVKDLFFLAGLQDFFTIAENENMLV
jgi:anti-sigma B factor antagonist